MAEMAVREAFRKKQVDPKAASLLEVVYGVTGSYRETAKICSFVKSWAKVRDSIGKTPNMEEYAAYWKVGRATAYREQALFREAFPDLHDPGPLLDAPNAGS